jgi:hypothetical protein
MKNLEYIEVNDVFGSAERPNLFDICLAQVTPILKLKVRLIDFEYNNHKKFYWCESLENNKQFTEGERIIIYENDLELIKKDE